MINHRQSRRYVVLITLAVTLCAPEVMAFSFGNLMGTMGGGSADTGADDPDAFVRSVRAAGKLMDKSTSRLVHCLADKESITMIKMDEKAANEVADPEERRARLTEVKKNKQAVLNKTLRNDRLMVEIQNMDADQKTELGAAAFNFTLALLRGKALMEQSKTLISSMSSNPAMQSTLGNVKEAASSVSNQVSSASTIADKLSDIFPAVGISGPISKDESPKITTAVPGHQATP